MGKIIDLTNKRFGKLVVLSLLDYRNNNGSACWQCKCDCGTFKVANSNDLRKGNVSSCGCLRKKQLLKHGESGTRLYNIWCDIKKRCYNTRCVAYKNYGGRGIKVGDKWLNDFVTFKEWSIDNGYNDKLTLDRIDVDGDYEPSNCRWTTMKEQANNTRKNVYILYKGERKTIAQWSEITNIHPSTIQQRLRRGWSTEDILTKQPKKKRTDL